MKQKKIYLAVDLGAGSGRVIAGEFDGQRVELHEINRFDNTPVELPSGWHWNLTALYQNILNGIQLAADRYGDAIVSLGIDTWGVDYGLLDKKGALLGLPYQYRDTRTQGMMEAAYELVDKKAIYQATGIQFMFFNSIFQLLSELKHDSTALKQAEHLLFIPDLLAYWLTGKMSQERSIASTSQLYNPQTKDWDYSLIEKLGLPQKLFKPLSDAGDPLGPLTESLQKTTGLKQLQVITVGGHDTASAVAAVPSQAPTPAYLSSGTWSLMGLEVNEAIISEASFEDAFTNEVGVCDKIRFLKNICGLWLIQESKRYWHSQGIDIPYAKMAALADEATPFRSLIFPDAPCFAEAGNMPLKIQDYCRETGQPVPETPGQIIRCIYESLALRYDQVWQHLTKYVSEQPSTLHIVGGGCQDRLLNQFAANAIGIKVAAGPVEATGLGNITVQMLADGEIADLTEGRKIVLNSSLVETFEPQDQTTWDAVKARFATLS